MDADPFKDGRISFFKEIFRQADLGDSSQQPSQILEEMLNLSARKAARRQKVEARVAPP